MSYEARFRAQICFNYSSAVGNTNPSICLLGGARISLGLESSQILF